VKYQQFRSARPGRNLQQQQLAFHRASRNAIVIHLANGVRLHGFVIASDAYMVLLGQDVRDPSPQVVYKHSIASIIPAHAPEAVPSAPELAESPDFVRIYFPRTRSRKRS
jgi:host factor-I protein